MARQINSDLAGKDVIFLGILNGAFLFAADLFRRIEFPAKISFVKYASYRGTNSSGTIKELIGWNDDIKNKTIVIIEDIIDTGTTIESIIAQIKGFRPRQIFVATLLLKPDLYSKEINLDYVGFRIPKNFVVGYGLDYNGFGRNLRNLYALEE